MTRKTSARIDAIAQDLLASAPSYAPSEQRVALAIYRLLATGEPVSPERIGGAADVGEQDVSDLLQKWRNVFFDGGGNVISFGGLAQRQTAHRLHVDGRSLFTWCAWDALFVPVILDRPAKVESIATGDTVSLTVRPDGVEAVAPATAVLSWVRADKSNDDVLRSFCRHVLFFATPEAGGAWAAQRDDALLLSIEDGFELGRRWVERNFGAVLST